jgi:hypothetical protein
MKEFFDKFWYDMAFARAVLIALLVGAGAYYAQPVGRSVADRAATAALFALGTGGAALSSSSGTRPKGPDGV